MLVTISVAIAVAAVLLAFVLAVKRRRGEIGRGGLLAPPEKRPWAEPRPAPLAPTAPAASGSNGWPEDAAPIHGLSDALAAEARELLAANRKIEAVELVRAATGCSLEEAVERVELL